MHRRAFMSMAVGLVAAGAFLAGGHAVADQPAVFTGLVAGTGAGGYDVVAYQRQGAAVPGDPALTHSHDGIAYRFANAEHRDAFAAAPGRYLPQFGGYCAWAVANGYTAKGDPEAWSVVDGRLYLNYSKAVRDQWSRDVPGNIARGEANWPGVLD